MSGDNPDCEPVYTPKVEYQCDGSTTHYQGCKCHEARRNALVTTYSAENKMLQERVRELEGPHHFTIAQPGDYQISFRDGKKILMRDR